MSKLDIGVDYKGGVEGSIELLCPKGSESLSSFRHQVAEKSKTRNGYKSVPLYIIPSPLPQAGYPAQDWTVPQCSEKRLQWVTIRLGKREVLILHFLLVHKRLADRHVPPSPSLEKTWGKKTSTYWQWKSLSSPYYEAHQPRSCTWRFQCPTQI